FLIALKSQNRHMEEGHPPRCLGCPRCSEQVFPAEAQCAAGKSWHKRCLRCGNGECNAQLQVTKLFVAQGDIFCERCYSAKFGNKIGLKRTTAADVKRVNFQADVEEVGLSSAALNAKEMLSEKHPEFASTEFLNIIELYLREKNIATLDSLEAIDYALVRRLAGDEESNQALTDLFNKLHKIVQKDSGPSSTTQPSLSPRPMPRLETPAPFPTHSKRQGSMPDEPTVNPQPTTSGVAEPRKPIKFGSVQETVERLELESYYPERIPRKDVLFVKRSQDERKNLKENSVAWQVIRALLSCDAQGRNLVPETTASDEMSLLNLEDDEEGSSENELNPIDILLASYLCCDKEVQQMLCKALFACKLAFPFIYSTVDKPLVMSSWSLKDIVVQFINENGQYIETSLMSDYHFPVVSFVRIGDLPVSKSKLLNSLLNGSSHETFFHRDCTNGHARRVCSNGLVEATVFLPSRNIKLTRAFLATNLRGDLLDFADKSHVLTSASEVVVVFVDVSTLSQPECFSQLQSMSKMKELEVIVVLYRSQTLANPLSSELLSTLKSFSCVDTKKKKPEREIVGEIQQRLSETLAKVGAEQKPIGEIKVDFDDGSLVSQASQLCSSIFGEVSKSGMMNLRKEHLPLQEKWMDYSRHYKKENSSKATDEDKLEAQHQRLNARRQQMGLCNQLSPIMEEFLTTLTKIADNELLVKLWLQCIRSFFDTSSREHLPRLRKMQKELRQRKEIADESSQTAIDDQLTELGHQILLASIGLENIFREAGQFYEAILAASSESTKTFRALDINLIPRVMAKLLLCGVPLEILDGDAGNIPSAWISAILKTCQELVGDKKIYVISVLGLQSSGKSTLLNTMFGLKFAVSAGRCTRGAFLQLVPVESGMPFDYVAVLDTEGLRAPELGLDKHHHDNELATLVIGLGDVTIINIKGENAAEMNEILQIAIHAFIRMKMANKDRDLHRHCIFIHQNVAAAGAKEMMQEATFKIQQKLDHMTKEAAEGEGLHDVKRFGDILQFNRDTDIFFMSDLLQGDPPMAPVNPGYSMGVQEIKQHLLHILDKEQKSYLGFSDFSQRVNDLWKAILSEDFVFSFKSSVELKAYNMLENKFLEVTNYIEELSEDWLYKSAAIPVRKCETVSAVADVQQRAISELRAMLETWQQQGLKSLNVFFYENQYGEYTIQWKERKLVSLRDCIKSLEQSLRQKLQILCDGQKVELQQGSRTEEWESKIIRRATELAPTLKSSSTEKILQEFEALWQEFAQQLPPERTVDFGSIESQVVDQLREIYYNEKKYVGIFLEQTPLKRQSAGRSDSLPEILFPKGDTVQLIIPERLKIKQLKSYVSSKPEKEERKLVVDFVSDILKAVQSLCEDMRGGLTGVSKVHVNRIQKYVCDAVNSSLRLSSNHIRTTRAFEIKVVVLALRTAYPTFEQITRNFYEANSIKTKLADTKTKMLNLFENIVRRQAEAKMVADFIRDHLYSVMKQAFQERMAGKLRGVMRNEIGRTKYQLIVRMLTDMAQRRDAESILEYVRDSHTTALKWLTQFINRQLFQRTSDGNSVFSGHLESSLIAPTIAVTEEAARVAATRCTSLKVWIDEFCKEAEKELAVLPKNLYHVCTYESNVKVEDMLKHLLGGLGDLKSTLIKHFASMNESTVRWHGDSTLYSDVLQSLWGCKERCPFCSEPCCKSQENHHEKDGSPHCCIQHRPPGVDGVYYIRIDQLAFNNCEFEISSDGRFSCGFCKRRGKQTSNCRADSKQEVYHPYKEYKKYFPEWEIDPDAGNDSAKFWHWFSWTFKDKLQAKYRKGIKKLPPTWELVSRKEAIDSLRFLLD
ncbi:hypothetical protein BOX15_Mlig019641g2, partial [Macrostomum lignano]